MASITTVRLLYNTVLSGISIATTCVQWWCHHCSSYKRTFQQLQYFAQFFTENNMANFRDNIFAQTCFCNFVEIRCRLTSIWCPSIIQSIVVYRCITCTYCISYQSIMHGMHARVTSLVYHAILVKNIAKFWKEKIWQI